MTIGIIVARNADRIIGVNGTIPWNFKGDLRRFKEVTMGSTVIMGRKTWESIPAKFRPLAGRDNIVISSTALDIFPATRFDSIGKAVDLTRVSARPDWPIWFIGGARIYAEAMQYADVIDVTRVPWTPPCKGCGQPESSSDHDANRNDHGYVELYDAAFDTVVRFPPIDETVFAPGPLTPHPYEPDLKLQRFERRK